MPLSVSRNKRECAINLLIFPILVLAAVAMGQHEPLANAATRSEVSRGMRDLRQVYDKFLKAVESENLSLARQCFSFPSRPASGRKRLITECELSSTYALFRAIHEQ
jgi:hypothetical protein